MTEKKTAYSVGEMAEAFGVSRDTLRLYDKMGILSPKKNEKNGYRVYSREDYICFDYIAKLKSLGMPLEDIKMMINECTIEKAEAVMQVQDKLIDEKIRELKSLQLMVRDYQKSFRSAIMHMGSIVIEESPRMLYKKIGAPMKEIMEAFYALSREQIPKFTFVIAQDRFMKRDLFTNPESRSTASDYAMTLIDEDGMADQDDFPKEEFQILEKTKSVHAVLKFYTGKDYSDLDRVWDFMEEKSCKIAGAALLRTLSTRNSIKSSVDYYDLWVPIE